MTRITNLTSLMEILRRQATEYTNKLGAKRRTEHGHGGSGPARVERIPVVQLKTAIRDRIRALDKQDQNYKKKAEHIFLESILAWEFGGDILNDRKFTELVTDIHASFIENEKSRQSLELLIAEFSAGDSVA